MDGEAGSDQPASGVASALPAAVRPSAERAARPMNFDRELLSSVLPAYDIGGELGQGGMGVVVSGQHRQLGRRVAIKQLPEAFAADHQPVVHGRRPLPGAVRREDEGRGQRAGDAGGGLVGAGLTVQRRIR